MTILPISIEKSASTLVGIFGDAAPAHARERMEEYDGDVGKDGYRFWLAVADEAVELLEQERAVRRGQAFMSRKLPAPNRSMPLPAVGFGRCR